jgi:hypothetical protein
VGSWYRFCCHLTSLSLTSERLAKKNPIWPSVTNARVCIKSLSLLSLMRHAIGMFLALGSSQHALHTCMCKQLLNKSISENNHQPPHSWPWKDRSACQWLAWIGGYVNQSVGLFETLHVPDIRLFSCRPSELRWWQSLELINIVVILCHALQWCCFQYFQLLIKSKKKIIPLDAFKNCRMATSWWLVAGGQRVAFDRLHVSN